MKNQGNRKTNVEIRIGRREFCAGVGATLAVAALPGGVLAAKADGGSSGQWHYYGGDSGATKYSALDQVNASNVENLKIAWRRPAVDPKYTNPTFSNSYETTPLMIDGVMYVSNGMGLVEAFDPENGKTIWLQQPPEGTMDGLQGIAPRGIAYWSDVTDARVFLVRGQSLYAVDAKTGKLCGDFGDKGQIDLRNMGPKYIAHFLSPPVVCRGVVIVGSASSDNSRIKKENHGDVHAFDVRTGKLSWTFHTIPHAGEFGFDTWKDDSASSTGAANVWAPFSADQELGYVYLPTSTPTADWYGGARLGNCLFGESLVCVDATTGNRIWHFQTVHHGLWDYDLPAAPVLATITVDGKQIKAVLQVTKTCFVFAFDRVTGMPVWPIEERAVPTSTTPGEQSSPTQPFPTKPAPFDRQGITLDDLIDFTPELRAKAVELSKQYVLGPLFTPPSVSTPGGKKGTAVLPGWAGGANWGGAAFDPDTGILYVTSVTDPHVEGLVTQDPAKGDVRYIREKLISVPGPDGLPFVKPPYGRITAIDMNRGEHVWSVPNGDGPRNHPLLKHLNLPPLGSSGRVGPLLTKTLLFVGEGDPIIVATPPLGGGSKFRAYNKTSGKVLWETEFPAGTTGTPMTYVHQEKQFIVVAIGGKDHTAELVALAV
jgi:quinoprotein glucose dehydrogenase